MSQLEEIFNYEILKQLEEKFYLMGFSDYYNFHMTMHNYLIMGSYSIIDKMLKKIGNNIYQYMDINFGLGIDEINEIIIKILMVKL